MTLDPQGVAVLAVLLALYWRAVTVLRWRGYIVPGSQQAFWYAGTLLIAIALLKNPWVHAFQHQCFFLASLLVWWAVVEPKKRRVSGELWKAGHLIGMRLDGMFLGMAFILMRVQAYPWYGDRAQQHGLSVLTDQQIGGGLMFLEEAT